MIKTVANQVQQRIDDFFQHGFVEFRVSADDF